MAKTRKTLLHDDDFNAYAEGLEKENSELKAQLEEKSKLVDQSAHVKALEDFLASIMSDLHWVRVSQQGTFPQAAARFNGYYQTCRSLLNDKGQEIDARLRG